MIYYFTIVYGKVHACLWGSISVTYQYFVVPIHFLCRKFLTVHLFRNRIITGEVDTVKSNVVEETIVFQSIDRDGKLWIYKLFIELNDTHTKKLGKMPLMLFERKVDSWQIVQNPVMLLHCTALLVVDKVWKFHRSIWNTFWDIVFFCGKICQKDGI